MGSDKSTIIEGFALTLWQMRAMEKGVGVFYSNLGYNYSGSGSSIPGYAPLIFEIELVEKPEK
jgi:FKBP-type peptidyl-prolyl cis-trans isomerase